MDAIAFVCSVADARLEPRLMATATECGSRVLVQDLAHQGCDAIDALDSHRKQQCHLAILFFLSLHRHSIALV
ncbi:hypothetical protein SPRG_16969 [Saprolegnia parasitica CBS 223.65]|uniref:Uncharacterized protein n=1 Tax=Saprolegnia parasitica (strain CBS 223.65) TaxID=695850 RepID=A0A067BH21_SAPPC|nr:hypothetical protein SPRG_16969 [Saprolegnia parasitica CBS 223.65]KDO17468.1 hypothetical protein SPRG_16969 [Saprolegnia parasitica CBS 223.65]|eukprot:XP_012211822.1 hypothetical protein SPRG_16969 [Saprolegnia parasitica CBS 223.65]